MMRSQPASSVSARSIASTWPRMRPTRASSFFFSLIVWDIAAYIGYPPILCQPRPRDGLGPSSSQVRPVSGLGAVGQKLEIEPVDVIEQFAEGFRALIDQAFAFFGGSERGIAHRAAWVQVLGLPGERRRPLRGEPAEVFLHRNRRGTKIGDRFALHLCAV